MTQVIARQDFGIRGPAGQVGHASQLDLYEQATRLVPSGAWSCDLNTEGLSWTGGVFDIFGLARDTFVERADIVAMYAEESRELLDQRRSMAIATRSGFTLEAKILRPDGAERWMRVTAATRASNGRSVALYGMKQDITDDYLRWESLRRNAECDALTGVANRSKFQSDFLGQLRNSPALSQVGGLALFDMDGFKSINDRWGHAAGDACLRVFAQRLKMAFAEALLVARIGGDEFAVLLPPIQSRAAAEAAIRRKVLALHAPAEWDGEVLPLGVSVGLAFADATQGFDPQDLFIAADCALYGAKRDPLTPLSCA